MFNVIIMLVVAIAFSIAMGGPWSAIKDAANVTESREIVPFLIYLACIWGAALLVLPGIFTLVARLANRLAGNRASNRTMTLRLAYMLVPVGIFAWIAFSLPMLMVNYSYILNVLSDPLGLGWNLFGTANYPYQPFLPEWIPLIQGLILLTGLYFGISRGYLVIKDIVGSSALRTKAMIFPSILTLLIVNIFLKLYMG
jgi:hypothetical protein